MTQQSSVGENVWEADQKHNELLGCSENSRSLQGSLEKIFCIETTLPIYHILSFSPKVLHHLEYLLGNRFSVLMVVQSAMYNSRHHPVCDIAIGDSRKLPPQPPPLCGQGDPKDTAQQNSSKPNPKHILLSPGCVSSPSQGVRAEHPEPHFGLSLMLQPEPGAKGSASQIKAGGQTFTHCNSTGFACKRAHTDAQTEHHSTPSARMKQTQACGPWDLSHSHARGRGRHRLCRARPNWQKLTNNNKQEQDQAVEEQISYDQERFALQLKCNTKNSMTAFQLV